MKITTKVLAGLIIAFCFLIGICAGVVLYECVDTFLKREGMPGGEVLILPLMAGLFFGGIWFRSMTRSIANEIRATYIQQTDGE